MKHKEKNDLHFCCTTVPIWKELYIQTVSIPEETSEQQHREWESPQ